MVGTVHMMCVIVFQVYYYAVEDGKTNEWIVKREVSHERKFLTTTPQPCPLRHTR